MALGAAVASGQNYPNKPMIKMGKVIKDAGISGE